jgi:hypothetical protein
MREVSMTPEEVRALYEQCLSNEKQLRDNQPAGFEYLRNLCIWLLGHPERRFLRTTVTLSDNDPMALIGEGQKYLGLLHVLREARNRDTRWYWIAQWLKDEGVTAPHQILPADSFRRLTKRSR